MQEIPDTSTFRSYLFFWIGQLVSLLGSSIVQFSIIWYITILTQSPLMLAVASLVGLGTQILLTPIAGVYADRLNRKLIIGIVDFGQAIATMILIILFFLNIASLIHIFFLLMLRGMFQAFHSPTVSAIIPTMVPPKHLSRMNSIDYLFQGFINLMGPLIGAILLSVWELPQLLWIDVLTFIVPLIPLLIIAIPRVKQPDKTLSKPSFSQDFKEGLGFLKQTRGLIPLLLLSSSLNFLLMPIGILLPFFINVIHAGTVENLALVMVAIQGGTIVASIIMATKKLSSRRDILISSVIYSIFAGYIIIALAPMSNFLVIAIGGIIIGFAAPIANITLRTIFQFVVPHDKLGRVTAVMSTLSLAMSPLGMIYGGIMAELIGTVPLFLISAITGILIFTVTWTVSDARYVTLMNPKELPPPEPDNPPNQDSNEHLSPVHPTEKS